MGDRKAQSGASPHSASLRPINVKFPFANMIGYKVFFVNLAELAVKLTLLNYTLSQDITCKGDKDDTKCIPTLNFV